METSLNVILCNKSLIEYDILLRWSFIHALANTIAANDIILHVNEVNAFCLWLAKKQNVCRLELMNVGGYVNFAYKWISYSR